MSNADDASGGDGSGGQRPPHSKLRWFVGTLVLLAIVAIAVRYGSTPATFALASRALVGDVWLESTCLHWRLGTSRATREPANPDEAKAIAARMEQLCAGVPMSPPGQVR